MRMRMGILTTVRMTSSELLRIRAIDVDKVSLRLLKVGGLPTWLKGSHDPSFITLI